MSGCKKQSLLKTTAIASTLIFTCHITRCIHIHAFFSSAATNTSNISDESSISILYYLNYENALMHLGEDAEEEDIYASYLINFLCYCGDVDRYGQMRGRG